MVVPKDHEVSDARKTKLGLYLTSAEAHDILTSDDSAKLLDVRTPHEYVFVGHAEQAMNIPLATAANEFDPSSGALKWIPNPRFVDQVGAWAGKGDLILVTCRSGGRSAMAVNALAAAGYTNVHNIIDGFEGDKVDDPTSPDHGKRRCNGWTNSGLPWTYAVDPLRLRYEQPS
jgi:rhodanese-related sulfurtransferase